MSQTPTTPLHWPSSPLYQRRCGRASSTIHERRCEAAARSLTLDESTSIVITPPPPPPPPPPLLPIVVTPPQPDRDDWTRATPLVATKRRAASTAVEPLCVVGNGGVAVQLMQAPILVESDGGGGALLPLAVIAPASSRQQRSRSIVDARMFATDTAAMAISRAGKTPAAARCDYISTARRSASSTIVARADAKPLMIAARGSFWKSFEVATSTNEQSRKYSHSKKANFGSKFGEKMWAFKQQTKF